MKDWSTLKKLIWLRAVTGGGSSGTITTVTGASPLALANALAKPIKSLVQYGKVTTSGGDTYCNNGKLTAVDDELPSGYKRLIGITFDGNLRYETGEALMGSDEVTMTLDNLASSGKNVFGSYNGANDKNFSMYIYGSSTSGSYFRYGDQLKRPKYGGTGQRTITFGKNGTSGFAENSTVDPDEFTTPANTYIGMLPNSSSAAFTGDIIGSITVSNRLEWIPCERESDGAIGYYEKFNGNFIAPSGSSTPVSLGYDNSHQTVLSVVGTPEVLSVGGKNLINQLHAITGSCSNTYYREVSVNAGDISAFHLAAGKTYTLSCDAESSEEPFRISVGCGNGGFSCDITNTAMQNNGRVRITFSATESKLTQYGDILAFRVPRFDVKKSFTFTISNIQLEDGSTATEYEPYRTPQTASVANLFATGDVKDEQDIISGVVTRKTSVSVSDGEITISALAEPVTERVTAQPMRTAEGGNNVSVTSEVGSVELSVTYMAAEGA